MQHHNQHVTELSYFSHLSTVKFGNPIKLCFKTWAIYTISKYQLLSAGLLVKSLNGKVVAMKAAHCLK